MFRGLLAGRTGVVLAAILVWTGSACRVQGQASDNRQTETVRLQLKWGHQFQFAGYYAAVAKGYYREAGLDVELVEGAADRPVVDSVVGGRAEYGIGTSALILAHSRGKPVVALAPIFQHSPLVLLARGGGAIETLLDLHGRTVAIEGDSAEILAYLKQEGMDLTEIILVDNAFGITDLLEGRVDAISAYSTNEPFVLKQQGADYRMFSPRSGGVDFYGDILFTTRDEVHRHPDRVKRMLAASIKGWEYALDHTEEVIELILTEYSQRHSREHLEFEAHATRRLILPSVVELGHTNPGRWRHIADTYAAMDMLVPDYDLDGFIYEPDRFARRGRFYGLVLGGVLLALVVASLWLRYFRLNRSLRAEVAERRSAQDRLQQSEERYRLLVEKAPFPVILSRADDGSVLYVNSRAEQVFAISESEVAGKPVADFYAEEKDRDRLLKLLDSQGYVRDFEARVRTNGGNEFWASVNADYAWVDGNKVVFSALSDITARKDLEDELRQAAHYDSLTGLANRRRFFEAMEREMDRASRYGHPVCLMMMDLDHFKSINDQFGHQIGDDYLRAFADHCRRILRGSDMMGRIGGEEFTVLLPETPLEEAANTAGRLRQAVESLDIGDGKGIGTTVSIGVVCVQEGEGVHSAMGRADRAMYEAKQRGRNLVVACDEETHEH